MGKLLIACVLLEPLSLWLAERAHAEGPIAVLEHLRVRHANPAASALGVRPGMPLHAAISRAPELHTVTRSEPREASEWGKVLDEFYAYSPRVESLAPGRALLTLREGAAREISAQYHARVGLAPSRELALLAALGAQPGQLRTITAASEQAALAVMPIETLAGAGVSRANVERLAFLGVRFVGELARWSRAQQAAYLGPDWPTVRAFLHGPRGEHVTPYRPAPDLSAALGFDEPISEPAQTDPALDELARRVSAQLHGRLATRLLVTATALGTHFSAAREAKEPLRDAEVVARLARLALQDTGAAPLGIERVQLTLTGLQQGARQVGLWPSVREGDAARLVLRRYPDALVRAQWRNPYSYCADRAFRWVHFVSGEPLVAEGSLHAPARPRRGGEAARAFFEGTAGGR